MNADQSAAPAAPPEQGGGAAEELAYRLRQQQLTAEFGLFALKTHHVGTLLQEATRLCSAGSAHAPRRAHSGPWPRPPIMARGRHHRFRFTRLSPSTRLG